MSANVLVANSGHHVSGRVRLAAVEDLPEGDVRRIDSAPSARRRREAQLKETPAMRRQPVKPRVASDVVSVSLGRVLVGVLGFFALVLCGIGVGTLIQPAGYVGPTVVHSVTAGESVWGLAALVGSDRSLESVVADIESLNDIDGTLNVGDQVLLPAQ